MGVGVGVGVVVGPPGADEKVDFVSPGAAGVGLGAFEGVFACDCGCAGVCGCLIAASDSGLSLVTRKLNFAPEPFGSHSIKLYDGK